MRIILFFTIFITIIGTAASYVIWRLLGPSKLSRGQKNGIKFAIGVIVLAMPGTIMLRRYGMENSWMDIVTWADYIGLGFLSFILTLLVIRDMGLLFIYILSGVKRFFFKGRAHGQSRNKLQDASRRNFLLNSVNTGIVAASGVFAGYGFANAIQMPGVRSVEIAIKNLPDDIDGFRIVQLTDIHVSPTIKRPFVEAVVERTNSLKPDVVALTGDLVDGSVERLENDVAPLSWLRADHGCFFVTGNHEYYSGVMPWIDKIHSLGFKVLLNEHHLVQKGNGRILISGVTDYSGGRFYPSHKSDPFKAMRGAPDSDYKILLAHQPKNIFKADEAGFDLQISGHTHGGQFFPWNFLVGLDQPYIADLHQYKNTKIYVSRGTGYWGPPLRLGSPSEITLFTLTKAPLTS